MRILYLNNHSFVITQDFFIHSERSMTPSPDVVELEASNLKLHTIIKHQEKCISRQKLKISALKRQNQMLLRKIKDIAKSLEPIQEKIEILNDVNLEAGTLIKRRFEKETKSEKEEMKNLEA